jgi:hypothetical protein
MESEPLIVTALNSRVYTFEPLPSPENDEHAPRIVWTLWSDTNPRVRALAQRLGIPNTEEELIIESALRHAQALEKTLMYAGRNITLTANTPCLVYSTQFNAIQISGLGYQPLDEYGITQVDQPISLPNSQNFVRINPRVSSTTVFENGGFPERTPEFSFCGAYTLEQAAFKVGANLAMLEFLAETKTPSFVVPIPIEIGVYPDILDPAGNPAYFIAFLVPYNGNRTGIFRGIIDQRAIGLISDYLMEAIPLICPYVMDLHTFGISHNQLVAGNFYMIHQGETGLPFFADFSTIAQLDTRNTTFPIFTGRDNWKPFESHHWGRAVDLSNVIGSPIRKIARLDPTIDAQTLGDMLNQLFEQSMALYLGVDSIHSFFPPILLNDSDRALGVIVRVLNAAEQRGIFHHNTKTPRKNWYTVQFLQKHIAEVLNQSK